jgi:predicted MPP superfamily phosphohydrolase
MSFDSGSDGSVARSTITRRSFLVGAGALGLGFAGFAGTKGRHALEITHRTFAIRDLPDPFVGMRMVQISDIHLEEYTEPWFLERVVNEVNALNPEIVLLTGDFISRAPRVYQVAWKAAGLCAEILSGLKTKERYAILGNHEAAVGPRHVIEPLKQVGIPMLVDSYVAIERGYERIWICGADDASRNPDLRSALPPEPRAPIILMAHEPDYVDVFAKDPNFGLVDLVLSGHTHGGQVRLPVAGPLILPSLGRKYVEGHFQIGRTQLYVNRGIGTVGLPMRFDCPAEITHFTLTRA